LRRSICGESSYGYIGKEAIALQANHAKLEGEEMNGGNREGVA